MLEWLTSVTAVVADAGPVGGDLARLESKFYTYALISGLAAVVWAIAGGLYVKFPRARKGICSGLLIVGFAALGGAAVFGATAEEEVRNAWGLPMVVVLLVGMVTAIVGYALMQVINRAEGAAALTPAQQQEQEPQKLTK